MLPSIITKTHRPSLLINPELLPHRAVRPPVQLSLFWETLRYAHLTAINHLLLAKIRSTVFDSVRKVTIICYKICR